MKKKIILSSILALGVLGGVVGVANRPLAVDAENLAANTYIYFEKPNTWNAAHVQFLIGHGSWSEGYTMTNISNTDIYYVKMIAWSGYTQYGFMNTNEEKWGGEGSAPSSRIQWGVNKTNVAYASGLPLDGTHNLFGGSATDPYAYPAKGNLAALNLAISAVAETGGTASVSGYELTSDTAVEKNEKASINVLKFTDITLKATANDGYEFAGWYDAETDGTLVSSNLTHTIKDVTEAKTYYAKFNSTVPEVPTVTELFTEYYNNGTYVKETVLNTNEFADEDVNDYFHAGAQVKYRQTTYAPGQLSMVTKATSEAEWGTHTSTYEDNGNGGVDHLTDGVKDYSVSGTVNGQDRSSVENWYVTLHDFVNTELTGWEYADGVYTLSLVDNELATKMAREFVAPMWLETEEAKNYVQFDKLTVEEVGESLVMKLYVDSTNSGQLVEGANLVFSQATITK